MHAQCGMSDNFYILQILFDILIFPTIFKDISGGESELEEDRGGPP